MAEQRHHSDIVIAGLILLGIVGWAGAVVGTAFSLPDAASAVIWFVSAFIAAYVSRRLLADLDAGELAIGAVVMIALVVGIKYERDERALDIKLLLPIAVAEAGVLLGAFTVRQKRGDAGRFITTVAAGAAGFGGAVAGIGITMLVYPPLLPAGLLVGAPIGGFVIAWFTPVRGLHGALGQGVAFTALLAAVEYDKGRVLQGIAIGMVFGIILGALGSGVGRALRNSVDRQRKPDLPEVRQVS